MVGVEEEEEEKRERKKTRPGQGYLNLGEGDGVTVYFVGLVLFDVILRFGFVPAMPLNSLNIQRLCCIEDEGDKREMEGWSMMLLLHQMPSLLCTCSKRIRRTLDSIGSSPCAFFLWGGKGDERVCSHSFVHNAPIRKWCLCFEWTKRWPVPSRERVSP